MNTLVIGYGSIGSRHARLLSELGNRVSVVSSRNIDFKLKYDLLSRALEIEKPEYIIIANKTSEHYQTLIELAENNFKGVILVEKPLFHSLKEIPKNRFRKVLIAYNLRFHPVIQKLHELLKNERLISVHTYVGQYLPEWRPSTDYRLSYSAEKHLGGGVLRDLSHELDYLNWILGGWEGLVALGGHYSHLEIDSDDIFNIMMTTNKAPIVNIQMNYLDRTPRREIIINTDDYSIKADLIKNILQVNNDIETFHVSRDITYRLQHQAILKREYDSLCSIEEGIDVMKMIDAAGQSAEQRMWVYR